MRKTKCMDKFSTAGFLRVLNVCLAMLCMLLKFDDLRCYGWMAGVYQYRSALCCRLVSCGQWNGFGWRWSTTPSGNYSEFSDVEKCRTPKNKHLLRFYIFHSLKYFSPLLLNNTRSDAASFFQFIITSKIIHKYGSELLVIYHNSRAMDHNIGCPLSVPGSNTLAICLAAFMGGWAYTG